MSDSKNPTRREAIRYLIAGAAAAACPIPPELLAAPKAAGEKPLAQLESEQNKLCHQVRDGFAFIFPEPWQKCEVAIIGGGPSGLMTAYKLRDTDFQLFEKEPRLGGNALSEQWRGQWYATGSAYNSNDDVEALCRELGMEILLIKSVDASIIDGKVVPEFWRGGLWRSPYAESVRKNFAAAQKDAAKIDLRAQADKLDGITFADFLKPYGPEIKAWFDNFGPNSWGGDTENTSALVGVDSLSWAGGQEDDRFTWPGGLGRISIALEEALKKTAADRLHSGATVLQAAPVGDKVNVSYMLDGEIHTIAAKAAVIACPKLIAKKIILGLDDAHANAMDQLGYMPYLVANVCYREVIYNGSYDTNIPAPCPIVDFNVADWLVNRNNRETHRPSILTCYMPVKEKDRAKILRDEYCIHLGEEAVNLLDGWFPGSRAKVEEVHIYRRGHAMYVPAPGVATRIAPAIRKPLGNIFFGHSDSQGGITEYSTALKAATRVSGEVKAALGKLAAKSSVASGV